MNRLMPDTAVQPNHPLVLFAGMPPNPLHEKATKDHAKEKEHLRLPFKCGGVKGSGGYRGKKEIV
eukprot:m.97256 g.97256  ORF g.97256 m.97256 type:complete len:65 (-) comp20515_c0_seq1:782-976(-)